MKHELLRYMSLSMPVELIYIDGRGRITKRKVKIISISENHMQAYCFTRKAPRSFNINNILAAGPIKMRKVV